MNMIPSIMLIIYALVVIGMLLDFHWKTLTRKHQLIAVIYLAALLIINGLATTFLGQPLYGKFYLFLVQLPVFIGFCLFSRYHGIKVFFVVLSTVIFTAPPMLCITSLRTFFHISMAISIAVFFLSYVLMILFIHKFLKPSFNYMLENCEARYFWSFCLIPTLYYIYSFATTKYNFIQPYEQKGYLIRQLPTIIVLTSYLLLVFIFRITRENQRLENEKALTQLQIEGGKLYLDKLQNAQEQTMIYRHNMRHHLSIISGLAAEENLTKIKEYLASQEADINAITPERHCDNEIANLILSSFHLRSRQKGVTLKTDVRLPDQLSITDTELCSLFSNALENAITAASELTDQNLRKVTIRAMINKDKLLISTENPYIGTIIMDGELPVSKKQEAGHGLGIKSMVSIVEHYGGLYSIETKNNMFVLRLMVPMK